MSNNTKEKFFIRISNFFKNIFNRNEVKQITSVTDSLSNEKSSSDFKENNFQKEKSKFIDDIKINRYEDPILLELQNQYERDEIDLNVLSDEQIDDLHELYKRQVIELKNTLDNKKTELIIVQHKMKQYSADV